jgi:DNA-directed RNA polymerase I, II, and III subunit RPABC2
MADQEYNNEEDDYVSDHEEDLEGGDYEDAAQRAEADALAKLFKQHPEIWIPYEEQIKERLNTKPPESVVEEESVQLQTTFRDVRNVDSKHRTYPFLTNYERTKCISYRASQICNGAQPYIKVPDGVTDAYDIAKMELKAKRLPFIIKRPLNDGNFEVWRLTDLMLIH